MKKAIWWVVGIVVVVVIVVLASRGSNSGPVQKQTIKIGATLPLTGNLAFLGENYKNAIELALKDLKNSDLKYDYQVVYEDDKFNPANGATTANKLISIDKVDAVLSFGSPVGNVVSPIAEQNKIVHINGIASDPTVAKGDYNFVHWTPPYEEAKLMVTEMQKKGVKKVVLFEQNQPGVLAVVRAFSDAIKGTDIQIVSDQKLNTGDTDFRSLISKAKVNNADIYLLLATSPELEILAKQIKDSGIKTTLTSIETFEFTDKPTLFEGLWYVNAADQSQAFIDHFTTSYGNPPKLGGGNGYDAINLLVFAFENAGDGKAKPKEDQVKQVLAGVKGFDGAMGKLSVDSDGIIDTQAVVRMIKDGKPVTIAP